MSMKAFLDKTVEKAISRKFLVWLTATGLYLLSDLPPEHWVWLSAAYIGSQGAADIIATIKRA